MRHVVPLAALALAIGCSAVAPPAAPPADGWSSETDPQTGTVSTMLALDEAPVTFGAGTLSQDVPSYLASGNFGPTSPGDVVITRTEKVDDGTTYVHVAQKFHGIPLYGAEAILTVDRNGALRLYAGSLRRPPADPPVPKVGRSAAEGAAKAAYLTAEGRPATAVSDYQLVFARTGGTEVVAHRFVLQASNRPRVILIDGRNGALLSDVSGLDRAVAVVEGAGEAYGTPVRRTFPVVDQAPGTAETWAGRYRLANHDEGQPGGAVPAKTTGIVMTEGGHLPTAAPAMSGPWSKDAITAYTNLRIVDRWFRDRFGRSFRPDSATAPRLRVTDGGNGVTPGKCGDMWASISPGGGGDISYGGPCTVDGRPTLRTDGDLPGGYSISYRATEGVLAHEFTHLFTTESLGERKGEAGALSESFSDIFAVFMNHALHGSTSFQMATEGASAPLRDLGAPGSPSVAESGPAALRDYDKNDDIHIGSLVPSHAFYLMLHGGIHAQTRVRVASPLSWKQAEDLYWEIITNNLSAGSTFRAIATAQLEIAERRKFPREAVYCAWRAVEVFTPRDDASLGKGARCALPPCPAPPGGPSPAGGGDAGACPSDAGAAPAPTGTPDPKPPTPINCLELENGFYCDPITSPYAAVQCLGHRRFGIQCPSGKRCDASHDGELVWANFCK